MKYLLDTNVYIEACQSEEKRARFRPTFFPLLPTTFLSAVVAYELYVNAQDRRTRSLVQEFISPMERTGRVVNKSICRPDPSLLKRHLTPSASAVRA